MTAYTTVLTPGRLTGAQLSSFITPGGASGDTFSPGPDIWLRVKTAGTATTVQVMNTGANQGPSGATLAPMVLQPVLAATDDRFYGPFPASTFADPSDGQVHVNYFTVTGVTVQVFNCAAQ